MESPLALLGASVSGSVELLTLCGAGALLSYLGHWNASISAALSNGVYKVFFPALVFGAVLDTVSSNRSTSSGSNPDLWIPLGASVSLSLIASLVAYPITLVLGRGKDEIVKRAIFMCLVLGNSNNMALIILQSLCDGYEPLRGLPKCITKSTAYCTLYILPVTVFTWTIVFPYLLNACEQPDAEEQPLLSLSRDIRQPKKKYSILQGIKDSLFCPPTVTLVLATVLGFIPGIPEMFLQTRGVLHPILMSSNLVGTVAVPLSSIIVGAELYESMTEEKRVQPSSSMFGTSTVAAICAVKLAILPLIGRILHPIFHLDESLSKLLRIFVLTEWTVSTANNAIIMASIIAEMIPGRGEQLRRDVAKSLFVQYLVSPLLVTLNTALALRMTFE